jgi:hypothetical protein
MQDHLWQIAQQTPSQPIAGHSGAPVIPVMAGSLKWEDRGPGWPGKK